MKTIANRCARSGFIFILSFSLLACDGISMPNEWAGPSGEPAGSVLELPIVGGEGTSDYPSVVAIEFPGIHFSGTLVGERVVLATAHELPPIVKATGTNGAVVHFGAQTTDGMAERTVAVSEIYLHPAFGIDSPIYYDVSVIVLAESIEDVPVMAINDAPLDTFVQTGDELTVLGFGVTDSDGDWDGRKRAVTLPVAEVTPRFVRYAADDAGVCPGDSGGPGLAGSATPVIVGVTTIGDCSGLSDQTRIDRYLDFIHAAIDRAEGPCKLDGTCATEGCRTADPDCDACGFDGQCDEDCARDLDCVPTRRRLGDECAADEECVSGICIAAPDDPRIRYCTIPCDSAGEKWYRCHQTDRRMACSEDELADGDRVCVYGNITPGAQGSVCQSGEDCRSGICHEDERLCVEPCGRDSDCRDGFECSGYGDEKVCTTPANGSCEVGRQGTTSSFLLVVLALAWIWRSTRPLRPGTKVRFTPHASP